MYTDEKHEFFILVFYMKYQASKYKKRKEAKINQLFISMETYELDGHRYINDLIYLLPDHFDTTAEQRQSAVEQCQ